MHPGSEMIFPASFGKSFTMKIPPEICRLQIPAFIPHGKVEIGLWDFYLGVVLLFSWFNRIRCIGYF